MNVYEEMVSERKKLAYELASLEIYEKALLEKLRIFDPATYGLPPLFFPKNEDESEEDYKERQNEALKDFVENKMYIVKDGKIIRIKTFPQMLIPLADIVFGRVNRAIWWAGRGTGKSLNAALFIFINAVYKSRSVLNLAGTGEQAKMVYEYTKGFWELFPGMMQNLIVDKPYMKETRLKNGQRIRCLESANKAVGKHDSTMVVDEACTDHSSKDHKIERGIQGAMSEEDHSVLLLSTFHNAAGLFQEYWDNANKKGYGRYRWDIFDAMEKCDVGLENATEDDPLAQKSFCQKECPLTWKREVLDDFGNIVGYEPGGCNAKARKSEGWMSRNDVLDIQSMNKGSTVFEVEFACERPYAGAYIYRKDLIKNCYTHSLDIVNGYPLVVGIDWGMVQTALVCGSWIRTKVEDPVTKEFHTMRGLGILNSRFLSNSPEEIVIDQIEKWLVKYKFDDVIIYADRSHPHCNLRLANFGWQVEPVDFGKLKEFGVSNLQKWVASGRLKFLVNKENIFLGKQMGNMKRDSDGKIKKSPVSDERGDHGPDAAMCMSVPFQFTRLLQLEASGEM